MIALFGRRREGLKSCVVTQGQTTAVSVRKAMPASHCGQAGQEKGITERVPPTSQFLNHEQ